MVEFPLTGDLHALPNKDNSGSRMQDQEENDRGMLRKAWRRHSERMMRWTEERQGKLLKCPS